MERASNGVPDYYDRLREVDVFEEQALYNTQGYDDRRVLWRRGRRSPASRRDDRQAIAPAHAARAAVAGAHLHRRRRRRRTRSPGVADIPALAAAVCLERERRRRSDADQRRTAHHRRRAAAGFRVRRSGRAAVGAARLYFRGKVRRLAPQQQLVDDRPPQARRQRQPGPTADRRAQLTKHGTLPALQGNPHERGLPHHRHTISGRSRARGPEHLAAVLGRGAVRSC